MFGQGLVYAVPDYAVIDKFGSPEPNLSYPFFRHFLRLRKEPVKYPAHHQPQQHTRHICHNIFQIKRP